MPTPVIVPLRGGSDGDPTHRPNNPAFAEVAPTQYLDKLATLWMRSRGEDVPGVNYRLDRLPDGYALFGRPRPGGSAQNGSSPTRMDYYLFGHPQGKKFDSPNRFFPHFQHLMDNGGNSIGCPCTVCNAQGGAIQPIKSSVRVRASASASGAPSKAPSKAPSMGRPKLVTPGMDTSRVDEEGTPDVIRNLINKLKKHQTVDEPITEPMSLDWLAEQECLPKLLNEIREGKPFLPRAGEIVLFVRELPDGVVITRERKTGHFKLYNKESKLYQDPVWQAGLISQTPAEAAGVEDLVEEWKKKHNVNYSGVRVEPLPDPNAKDKSLSKRYRYVPLHQTRPFIFWEEYLGHIDEEKWHPTIKNALTAMATISALDKYHFKGKWPEAWIHTNGIYVGSELLIVGDTIRLLPKPDPNKSPCTDIMVIKAIRFKLSNLDLASENDYDEGRPYNTAAYIFGRAYTTDASRSNKLWYTPEDREDLEPIDEYKATHPLHPPEQVMQIPFARVLGRLYDADAMTLWLLSQKTNAISPRDLDRGRRGVLLARDFAARNDNRIAESEGSNWYWGDNRADALDLQTVNGLEVSRYDPERKPKEWRKDLKVIQEMETEVHRNGGQAARAGERGLRGNMAPANQQSRDRDLSAFMAPAMQQSRLSAFMAPSQQTARRSEDERSGTGSVSRHTRPSSSGTGTGSGTSLKRSASKIIDLTSDDDEDDDEDDGDIRKQDRLVEEAALRKKKAKVAVIIK